ncbi:hypothetical protein DYB32_008694, partial [Aphanomyces invadans]
METAAIRRARGTVDVPPLNRRSLGSNMHAAATAAPTRTVEPAAITMCSQELMTQTHLILSSTPKYAPCYVTTLLDTNINSTKLREDCDIPECFSVLNQNKVAAAASPGLNCYVYDIVTRTAFRNGDAVNFCFPTTTVAPPTSSASALNTNGDSTSVVGGAIGGAVGLVLLVGLVWWCRRRTSRRNDYSRAANFNEVHSPVVALPVPKPVTTNNSSHHPTTTTSFTGSSGPGGSNPPFLNNTYDGIVTQGLARDLEQLELHRIPFADVCLVQPLAEGAFGQVWLGNY